MDILEILTPVSKIFEGEGLIACEVETIIAETLRNIEEEIHACSKDDEFLTSHLASFKGIEEKKIFCATFIKADDMHKKNLHKERVSIEPNVVYSDNLLLKLKQILSERFDDQKGLAYQNMKWYDPKNWSNNRTYGIYQILNLYTHFKIPLDACNFELDAALHEWKNLCTFVSTNYRGLEARPLWEKIFQYKRRGYENICLLAELIMSSSGSNSKVEKAF